MYSPGERLSYDKLNGALRAAHVKTGKPWVVLRFTPRCCLGGVDRGADAAGGSGGKERMSHKEAGIVRQGQGRGMGAGVGSACSSTGPGT